MENKSLKQILKARLEKLDKMAKELQEFWKLKVEEK